MDHLIGGDHTLSFSVEDWWTSDAHTRQLREFV